MPSKFRIPKATIDGAYGAVMTRVAQRMWGEVPDNAHVLLHNKPVLKALFGFEGKVARWKALDPDLKTYAVMASAATIGCSWCLDFGYFLPGEGASDRALALFSFPSLADYETYRSRFGVDPEFVAADGIRDTSGCVLRYERSFMRPLLGADD